MAIITRNEFGTITIENEVISRIAGLAAMDCYGIVGMAARSVKDGIVQLLKRESLTKGICLSQSSENSEISENGNLLSIDLHIIVEYGTNISAIANTLINTVKYKIKENIGLTVGQINIFVEGIRVTN